MEEIVTVDGKQFKLTIDRPLTATERANVISDIRKQSGCSTCGTRTTKTMAGKAGIATLLEECVKTTISSDPADLATLEAYPNDGTAPYIVTFLGQFGAAPVILAAPQLDGSNPQTVLTDGTSTVPVSYRVSDAQIVASAGGPPAVAGPLDEPPGAGVNGSGIPIPAGEINTVRFIVHTSDSCPTGILHCVEFCNLGIICPTPTCNFIVS